VRIVAADGSVLYEGEKAALCRCGRSANKPFCDGTHKTVGFED
jgi:CDGSH-type Zn-finger protein